MACVFIGPSLHVRSFCWRRLLIRHHGVQIDQLGRLAGRWILAFDSNGHGEPAVSGILFVTRHNDPAARIGDAIIPKRIPGDYGSIRAARFGGTVGIDDGYGAVGFNVITAGDYYPVKKVGPLARRSVILKAARDPRVIRAVTGWVGSHH